MSKVAAASNYEIMTIIKDETEWLKDCPIMLIAINPGAKKSINEYPST